MRVLAVVQVDLPKKAGLDSFRYQLFVFLIIRAPRLQLAVLSAVGSPLGTPTPTTGLLAHEVQSINQYIVLSLVHLLHLCYVLSICTVLGSDSAQVPLVLSR
jgi:hypothetical protein